MLSKFVDFGIYCTSTTLSNHLISLFVFSTNPFSQEEYGFAKKKLVFSNLDMFSWSANSVPLPLVYGVYVIFVCGQ